VLEEKRLRNRPSAIDLPMGDGLPTAGRGTASGPTAAGNDVDRPQGHVMSDLLFYDQIDRPGLASLRTYTDSAATRCCARRSSGARLDRRRAAGLQRARPRRRGFAMGKKASFLPKGDMDKYLVCNADESEPGTFKDRELMQKTPHTLIEGMIIAAYAIGAIARTSTSRRVRATRPTVLEAAVDEAKAAGLPRRRHLGSDFSLELWVHRGAGAYICGEETALLDALEGKRGNPRLKPPSRPSTASTRARRSSTTSRR
jgi:NADH-quinone oxidoreductase subunit F